MQKIINASEFQTCNLEVNTLYKSESGELKHEPIKMLLPVGNLGGFRKARGHRKKEVCFVVIYTTLSEPDWPDRFIEPTNKFEYFGDKRVPGDILDTKKKGNLFLKQIYSSLKNDDRISIPPILVFAKGELGRDVVFKGLAVPSSAPNNLEIVVGNSKDGIINNFKAIFDILDTKLISRAWLNDLLSGNKLTENSPDVYTKWILGDLENSNMRSDNVSPNNTQTNEFSLDDFTGEIESSNGYLEGSLKQVLVSKYERSSTARTRCINLKGVNCHICKLNFQDKYGEIGRGFIHIHHLIPINMIKSSYKVNYANDLVPVCPNCHAMLHRKINGRFLSIEELKFIIRQNEKK